MYCFRAVEPELWLVDVPSPQSTVYAPAAERAMKLESSSVIASKPTNLLSDEDIVPRLSQSEGRTQSEFAVVVEV